MRAPLTAAIDIAVLEDDHDFRGQIAEFLERSGPYSVRAFAHADDLFEACRQRLPHIVLLDVKMGEFHGIRILEQLLARWPELCVVVVTGSPSLEDMRATFKMKVFDYLVKPCSLSQIHQTIENAINSHGFRGDDTDRFRHRLGHRIRVLRVDHDWSLKQLADSTGLSVSQISSIERGAHFPSMESLIAISRAFKLTPSEILASIDY